MVHQSNLITHITQNTGTNPEVNQRVGVAGLGFRMVFHRTIATVQQNFKIGFDGMLA